ncbi:MAG: DUF4214 domain-containing protein [Lachnospiraceae bacterium]|nr:DUF4214 domain-containing protein [Lachnospiraceae bacterium]
MKKKCIGVLMAVALTVTSMSLPSKQAKAAEGSSISWDGVLASATASGQAAESIKVTSDSDNLYVRVEGNNLGSMMELFIDPDNNGKTGYVNSSFDGAGMDYMVEGTELYKHPDNDGTWTTGSFVGQDSSVVSVEQSDTCIDYSISRTILGNEINLVFWNLENWSPNCSLPAESGCVSYVFDPDLVSPTPAATEEPTEAPNAAPTDAPVVLNDAPLEGELTQQSFVADNEHVKVTGRTKFENNQRILTFSAAKVEFKFFGTAASIDIYDGDSSGKADDHKNHVGMYLDGERVVDELIKAKDTNYVVLADEGQDPQWHVVSVVKLSEYNQGTFAVKNINVKAVGEIKPTDNREHYIEYIGDSITCGYGVLDDGSHDFMTIYEDATATYAGVSARILGADCSYISSSGSGILSGYSSKGDKNLVDYIPKMYEYEYDKTRDFDICVINIGTNDCSYVHYDYDNRSLDFIDEYIAFIRHLKDLHGEDVKVVGCLGQMWVYDNFDKLVEDTIAEYNKRYPDDGLVFFCQLPYAEPYGLGSGSHPGKKAQQAAGETLAKFIQDTVIPAVAPTRDPNATPRPTETPRPTLTPTPVPTLNPDAAPVDGKLVPSRDITDPEGTIYNLEPQEDGSLKITYNKTGAEFWYYLSLDLSGVDKSAYSGIRMTVTPSRAGMLFGITDDTNNIFIRNHWDPEKAAFGSVADQTVQVDFASAPKTKALNIWTDPTSSCPNVGEQTFYVKELVLIPAENPTEAPTTVPSKEPTTAPSEAPTTAPTTVPSEEPTTSPTTVPTAEPTTAPTEAPTTAPTEEPTVAPTAEPTIAPTNEPTGIEKFVTRCYEVAFQREPDEGGFNYWKGEIENGKRDGSFVVFNFVFGPEYKAQNTSNEQFVKDLYTMFMGREPDESGYNYWMGELKKGATRETVFTGFANSKEFYNLCKDCGITAGYFNNAYDINKLNLVNLFIERMYKVCFSRLGDQDGQNYWAEGLMKGQLSGTSCAANFINSKEYAKLNLSNEEYVKNLYVAFMGRDFDQNGLNFWMGELESGKTRDYVFSCFANSVEFKNICDSYGIKVK